MRLVPQLSLPGRQGVRVERSGRPGLDMLHDRMPEALQEAITSLHTLVGPLERLLRRRREHHEQAHRVGAVLADQFLRVDDVALVLRHLGAVLEHHALRQQVGERFGHVGQALVAHDALEEA